MNQYQYCENYYLPANEGSTNYNYYLNNSTSPQLNEPYYNNYWYSRSDCSSSSFDSSKSTSPQSIHNNYDNRMHDISLINYYSNNLYQQPLNVVKPLVNQLESTPVNASSKLRPNTQMTKLNNNDSESQSKNLLKNFDDEILDDKFSKEILPLINAVKNGDNSGSSKRRMRTAFTSEQRKYLLKIFEKQMYPSKDVLEELSKKLNVTSTILQTWFKNMRAKKKKVAKSTTTTATNYNDDEC